MLSVSGVHTYYGAAHILFDISLEVAQGEVVGLVGRNGVGKTTCLRSILGLTPAREGSMLFRGREIIGLAPFRIARLGLGYVPGDRRIFPDLTVHETSRSLPARPESAWTAKQVGPSSGPTNPFHR